MCLTVGAICVILGIIALKFFVFFKCKARDWLYVNLRSLPGESQGRGSLVSCHLWGCTESDTTEAT